MPAGACPAGACPTFGAGECEGSVVISRGATRLPHPVPSRGCAKEGSAKEDCAKEDCAKEDCAIDANFRAIDANFRAKDEILTEKTAKALSEPFGGKEIGDRTSFLCSCAIFTRVVCILHKALGPLYQLYSCT